MDKEWVDVVDTAVKIGFGSLITGVFAYLGIRQSSRSEKEKYILSHRINLIETIAGNIEAHIHAVDMFWALASGIARNQRDAGSQDRTLSSDRISRLRERNKVMTGSWESREFAIARLRVMGASAVVDSLYDFKTVEKKFRDKIMFGCIQRGEDLPTYDDLNIVRKDLNSAKREVYDSLSEFYSDIQK